MTFEEALNSTSKQIEYLGGLKAFIPYMPFPVPLSVDDIREKIREDPNLMQDNYWYKIAATSNINDLLKSKDITSVSIADLMGLIKQAARQIAALTDEEIDELYGTKQKHKYYISVAIDGRITVPVYGYNPEDAKNKVQNEICDINMGDIECIEWKPVNAEDINGNLTDY